MTTADRMKLLEKLNKLAGYTAPKTIFPEGTPLIAVGEQNLARERERLAALPTLSDFSAAFLASQRAADHRDVSLRLADLTMAPTGHLRRRIGNGQLGPAVAVTPTALQQLVGLHRDVLELPTGFASTLQWALAGSPADRADAAQLFNQLARRAAALGGDTLTTNRVGRTAIDASTGQRYLYSFTSEKHVGIAGGYAAMVQALHAELDGVDARVSVVHQGHDRLDVSVVFPMVNREIRVGDVLWGELTLTLSEAKDVAASVRDGLMRVLCVNLTRAAYGREEQWTRKHVGGATFVRDLLGRVRGGYERLKPFVAAFGDSYADPLPRTRAEVVERTLRANTDLTRLLPAATILQAWDMDGGRSAGDTRGGLVNALTRASKALGVADAEVVEAFAGRVVTQGWASIGL